MYVASKPIHTTLTNAPMCTATSNPPSTATALVYPCFVLMITHLFSTRYRPILCRTMLTGSVPRWPFHCVSCIMTILQWLIAKSNPVYRLGRSSLPIREDLIPLLGEMFRNMKWTYMSSRLLDVDRHQLAQGADRRTSRCMSTIPIPLGLTLATLSPRGAATQHQHPRYSAPFQLPPFHPNLIS